MALQNEGRLLLLQTLHSWIVTNTRTNVPSALRENNVSHMHIYIVIPRQTSDPANKFLG